MTNYRDWEPRHVEAVIAVFDGWSENRYDVLREEGCSEVCDEVADNDNLLTRLHAGEVHDLCRHDLRALENAAWVYLDTSGHLPDDEPDYDFFNPDDLRQAAEIAGWEIPGEEVR